MAQGGSQHLRKEPFPLFHTFFSQVCKNRHMLTLMVFFHSCNEPFLHFHFLDMLVALHFTPVSKSLGRWVAGQSFGLA